MTIVIRQPRDGDFFPWLSLYEEYAAARGAELTEQKALLLWTWVTDPAHVEKALVALDDEGELVGFAHFHSFPRPLEGDSGVFIDAFRLAAEIDDPGAGQALLDAIREAAAAAGATVLRWTQAPDEQLAEALVTAAGEPSSPATYELQTASQPA